MGVYGACEVCGRYDKTWDGLCEHCDGVAQMAAAEKRIAELEATNDLLSKQLDTGNADFLQDNKRIVEQQQRIAEIEAELARLHEERVPDDVLDWIIDELIRESLGDCDSSEFDTAVDISEIRRKNKEASE